MIHLKDFFNSNIFSIINFSLLTIILFTFSGCQVIGDIFKAGVWVGIIIVIIVIALLIWIIRKFIS